MIELLRNKNQTTRFQILVEIANSGPNIQQRDIAGVLDITPQAVSDYIGQLIKDGLLLSEGRSKFKITNEGVNWVIKALRELTAYNSFIEKAITDISICTAIADSDITAGQKVGLEMKDGLLLATEHTGSGASGTATSEAKRHEDVGITDIEGIVPLQGGRVTILRVPGIQKGGSARVDRERLRQEITGRPFIAALGIEAAVALTQASAGFYLYGATEATVEAAQSGLNPLVVCVENESASLIKRLEEENLSYELFDIGKG